MARKTRQEILDEASVQAQPGTLDYWRIQEKQARTHVAELTAERAQLALDKERAILIPQLEVKEMFNAIFGGYRRATKEIDRRYGPEAAAILIQAEKSAIRAQLEKMKGGPESKTRTRKRAPRK